MPEINLLQSSNNQNSEKSVQNILSTLGVVLLILVVLSYASLYFLAIHANSVVQKNNEEQASIQQSIQSQSLYPTFVANQLRVKNLGTLLDNHLNWCMVLPDFAQNTLKTAKFTKFDANSEGGAIITGSVPDFQGLAKLIQGYEQSQQQFVKEVKLVNVGLGSGNKTAISYTINVTFNNKVLAEYKNQCNS